MKNLIVYCSAHGTVEKISQYICDSISETEMVDLKDQNISKLEHYDMVIIGASIHMGTLNRNMRNFLNRNEEILLNKRIGIFLCCMHEDMQAQLQFESCFSEALRQHATATALPGGELQFSKMNFLQRAIVKKVSGTDKDQSNLNDMIIDSFIQKMKKSAVKSTD